VGNRTFNLGRVGFFVIDEADRMFDLGFEPQVSRIAAKLRPDRVSALFSATFPHIVERCARKLLNAPVEIVVGVRNTVSKDVEQRVEIVKGEGKLRRLFGVLGEFADRGQALVFANTQERAEEVFGQLVQRGYRAALLHGGMAQVDRASIIHDFRLQKYTVLVLTSVGSRGLDIMSVALVVNYDAPDHEADYVHRLGRTGRAGNRGWGVTFVEPLEKANAAEILAAMKKSKATVPAELEAVCEGEVKRKWGFGGHGFRFDKSETIAFKQERKQRTEEKAEEEEEPEVVVGDQTVMQRSDGKFICEFAINDFPSSVRGELTARQTLEPIMDESATTIIQRGLFVVPGERVPIGERKLCLLIEGQTKFAVQVAKQALEEIVSRGMSKREIAQPVRYKVV
jgi:ATP-dependent RNA helicase DDX46/PRP5